VVHTGIVRDANDDGSISIESKWGLSGRYLHRPADQPYSKSFAYYRSRRTSHSLRMQNQEDALPSPPVQTETQDNSPRFAVQAVLWRK
jgi:hypothetical protein